MNEERDEWEEGFNGGFCAAFLLLAFGIVAYFSGVKPPEEQVQYKAYRCVNCWHDVREYDDYFKCPADLLTDNSLAGCITESGVACWHEDGTDEIVCDIQLPESPSCSTCPPSSTK